MKQDVLTPNLLSLMQASLPHNPPNPPQMYEFQPTLSLPQPSPNPPTTLYGLVYSPDNYQTSSSHCTAGTIVRMVCGVGGGGGAN